jgi:hypothetical protein
MLRASAIIVWGAVLLGCRVIGLGGPQDIPAATYDQPGVLGVLEWVRDRVSPAQDHDMYGIGDYWATPEETLSIGGGDCEDYAILSLYLIDRDLGIAGAMVTGASFGMFRRHAWIRVDGVDYDPEHVTAVDYTNDYGVTGVLPWGKLRTLLGI